MHTFMILPLLVWSSISAALGPTDELIAMIKSHNNQENIATFVTQHPTIVNNYVAGYTPLMHAIFEQLSDVALRLIGLGADIHLKDQNNLGTALMYAVSYDLPDTTQALISHGARTTDTDRTGKTVWDYLKKSQSMNNPNTELIKQMLEKATNKQPAR